MRNQHTYLVLAVLALCSPMMQAERKPLPAQHAEPIAAWTEMAAAYAHTHATWLVKVQGQQDYVRCDVKAIDTTRLRCKAPHGKTTDIAADRIREVATVRKSSGWEWADLWGVGFIGGIGASAGYGAAVLVQMGGLALLAAAPLALVTVAVASGLIAMVVATASSNSELYPDKLLYRAASANAPVLSPLHP